MENNYIIEDIKTLLKNIKTDRKLVDLTPELSEKDYGIITKLMNMHNGAYIPVWKGKSGVDNIDNIQKLALFTRTMRLTKQTDEFIGFDMNKWDIVVDGIIRKPKEAIMPLLEYKANSKEINEALSDLSKMTPKIQEKVDMITKYLDAYVVKKDFTVYRGDKSFNILPTVNINGQEIDLSIIIENATLKYQELYKKNKFSTKQVENLVEIYLKNKTIPQSRFMSTAMTESATKEYAKKIKMEYYSSCRN